MSLDRRSFIQTGTASIAGLALGRSLLAQGPSDAGRSGRSILPINQNWRYSKLTERPMVERDYDDSAFSDVTLPHANVDLPWHDFDQRSYQFVSIYRRAVHLPADLNDRRVFVDFDGAMTASTVWLNGNKVGSYKGGYTPFSFELTSLLDQTGKNMLAVEVDSRELAEVPPFGYEIDFLTFGGIYREVSLRLVPATYIENIFVRPSGVTDGIASLSAVVYLDQSQAKSEELSLDIALLSKGQELRHASLKLPALSHAEHPVPYILKLDHITGILAWDLEQPSLYEVRVALRLGDTNLDQDSRKVGFRTAAFTERGFELNGGIVKLRGLNRHQTYPYVGGAMPARVQRRDAQILKHTLKCNMVRTSHYPQSPHFLDACDELGLLVLEEIPGWQHVGDVAWQDLAVDNVRRMIRRDWNRPSIILWSIRINESQDDQDLYTRTNALAHELDPTRQTCGVRYFQESKLLEDVFCMNDFKFPLKTPNHPLYLNTEFVGAEWPVRSSDNNAIQREHVLRYARIYNQIASDARFAGGLGWCAFDYNTHADFGGGDHVCYMGVMDMFREPKAAAGFFKSQCDPSEEVVLEPAFSFAENDEPGDFKDEVICSNCDMLQCFIKPLDAKPGEDFHRIIELKPAHDQFPHLRYPPFFLTLPHGNDDWGDLRIDGWIRGKKVISKTLSGAGIAHRLEASADDPGLFANGSDATRVAFRVVDEYGNALKLCADPLQLTISGPADIIGPNLVALSGGTVSVWVRAKRQVSVARLSASHPVLGSREIEINITAVKSEIV
jgi:beta-galactosidase